MRTVISTAFREGVGPLSQACAQPKEKGPMESVVGYIVWGCRELEQAFRSSSNYSQPKGTEKPDGNAFGALVGGRDEWIRNSNHGARRGAKS
jgi:hypothetical protein